MAQTNLKLDVETPRELLESLDDLIRGNELITEGNELRADAEKRTAAILKAEKRKEIIYKGYRISLRHIDAKDKVGVKKAE